MTKLYKSEADMCREFIDAVPKASWAAYAETGGFDLVLARRADGFQIGIEAKLRINLEVFEQVLDYSPLETVGPDTRAILVPEGGGGDIAAAYIGLTIIRMHRLDPSIRDDSPFTPILPTLEPPYSPYNDWHEWCPTKRLHLPSFVPDVRAGASAPIKLTPKKIKMIKLAITLDRMGSVDREDFKHLQLDPRWLLSRGAKRLTLFGDRYHIGPTFPDLRAQHPIVYAAIEGQWATWSRHHKQGGQQSLFSKKED